jgi:hypothetical protein
MFQIGDRVQIGSRIGAKMTRGTVTDIIPANDYREAMYRVRCDVTESIAVTLTPNPNEIWVDEGLIYGPFIDQNIGWDN